MPNDHDPLPAYLTAWQLANPQLLTQTNTSRIYTATHDSQPVILKLLAAGEVDEQRGALALHHFAGHGAVHLLRADAGAQLLEYASGDELITLVERGADTEATRMIAQVIGQLHSVPQDSPPAGLMPLDRWFADLFTRAAVDQQTNVDSIYVRGAALTRRLLATPRDIRVLHGDIHHRNIRQSARGWLAFDPKGIVGERTYDCANTLCNPPIPELVHNETRLLATAAILADALELDVWRVLAFTYAYACLNASWWLRLGGDDIVQWSLKVATIIEPHLA
ncbi:MAG TPA: aminoglycoside phosphotransferase family protein [Roseiflexaceae bacterium]|nr:aminoglycoside phosphotransferase family protein [Roseiflexaceae bacterium]HMP41473.1 aminoglycoside phosphotransferase family protein [Roseiflexaceae bacterium]